MTNGFIPKNGSNTAKRADGATSRFTGFYRYLVHSTGMLGRRYGTTVPGTSEETEVPGKDEATYIHTGIIPGYAR